MSIIPFDPAKGLGRYLIFSDAAHVSMVWDEELQTVAGASFTAEWISASLNRQQAIRKKATLRLLTLDYVAAADTAIDVAFSGDGGLNWSNQTTAVLAATVGRMQTVSIPGEVTGYDVRFRLRFITDVLVTVLAWTPYLTVRGRTNVN